jgi:hypothetical protein
MISKYGGLFRLLKRCSLILIAIALVVVVAMVIFNNSSETKPGFSTGSTIMIDPGISYQKIDDSKTVAPFVKPGALQIKSVSFDSKFFPRVFINENGGYVVVVECNSGGNFSISGLAAGDYGISYTTADQVEVNLPNQTISGVQPTIVTGIPKRGVLTVYAVPSTHDNQAPTTPIQIAVYYLSPFQVKLAWDESKDNTIVAGYKVYRDGIPIGFSQTNSFEDNKVRLAASYSYRILAYDTAANKSSLSTPLTVTIPDLSADEDLVGYWKFDEGNGNVVKDISDNGRRGSIIGAEWASLTKGYVLNFDGVDDYIKIETDSSLNNLEAVTMIAWIYPMVDSHWHVLDKGDGDKRIYAEGMKNMLDGRVRYSGVHAFSGSVSNTIALDTWQHVAMTWSQKTNKVRLFHNGSEVQYRIQDIGLGNIEDDSAYPYIIGTRGALGNPMFFKGYIDEVQLYKRVLSPKEIQAVYNWSASQYLVESGQRK